MSGLDQFCKSVSAMKPASADALLSVTRERSVKKGDTMLTAGQYCRDLFFLETGLVKICVNTEGREFIMRFFSEGSMFTVLDSLLNSEQSHYDVVALEHSTITVVPYQEMEQLCLLHHDVETFFRKFLGMASVNMMARINEMLTENASVRYTRFMSQHHALVNRLSLGDIAAYLGITPVSLSRIRSQH